MSQLKFLYAILFALFLAILGMLLLNTQWVVSLPSQLAQIKTRNELRVGTMVKSPSYLVDSGGTASGLDYELSQLFSDYLETKLTIKTYNNIQELFTALSRNDIDIVAAALSHNSERTKQYRTSPSYYSVSQQLVYRQGTRKPADLSKLSSPLVIPKGAASIPTLLQLQESTHKNLRWFASEEHSSRELLRQVANGQIAYTISDSVTVSNFQHIYPQLAVAFDVSEEEPVMWYFTKSADDSFYASVLDFFRTINEKNILTQLEEKYLGHISSFDYVDARTYVRAIENILPNFRPLFEKYATPEIDWRLLASVAYQESHWNPLATSPTGVRGLMMLTRLTANSLGVTDRLNPEQSVQGGAKYLEYLLKQIPKTIPQNERIWFALAAYNIGFAHMQDARRLTELQNGNANRWADVKHRLPMLTRPDYNSFTKLGYARGYQAYRYVENIRRYKISLDDYLNEKRQKEIQTKKTPNNAKVNIGTTQLVQKGR